MKKKSARKPAKRTWKAETVIKAIGELSEGEREKFDKWMAHELFYDAALSQGRRTGLSYSTYDEDQILLGGLEKMQPLKSPLQLVCTMRDLLQKFMQVWAEPGGIEEKVRKFNNMFRIKQPDVHNLIKKLREDERLSYGQIAACLNDAGYTQTNGKEFKTETVNAHCNRNNIKKKG